MILYADDIVLMCNNVDELAEIVNINDHNFARFGLKIANSETETMAFNVPEEVKAQPSLISVRVVALKNVSTFKYLGQKITNNNEDPSHYLNFLISSAFKKWNELKHVLTDRRILMSTNILEAYSVEAWQISATEQNKIESLWHGFLLKMVTNGFKCKNISKEYLNARKKGKVKRDKTRYTCT